MALCNEPLVELANSGASGSLFYVTNDDEFIVKTVQHKEAEFLQKLLPGYYLVSLPLDALNNEFWSNSIEYCLREVSCLWPHYEGWLGYF